LTEAGEEVGGGGSFGSTVLEGGRQSSSRMFVGIGEHVHQVRDGGALIARYVRNAGLAGGLS